MRGYVERLEREHFRHGDHCACEIDLAEHPRRQKAVPHESFEEEMARRWGEDERREEDDDERIS